MMMGKAGRGMSLEAGLRATGLTYEQLWLRQIALGGIASRIELEAYVHGVLTPDPHQHDVIAQALNECFVDSGGDHPVAYAEDLPAQ
jgi:hypothetical protein